MKLAAALILALFSLTPCIAQDNYDVDLIPAALRNRANAVIRNEETSVNMLTPSNVLYTVKQAITILNKNGEDNARLVLFYDKNTNIKSVNGEIYNEVGKLVGKFNESAFKDESAVNDFSLFEDNRVKHYLPNINVYPYTVVYNYTMRYKQNLIIQDWKPKPANDISVEKSSYTFICKPTDQFRIKLQQIANKAEEQVNEKQKSLIWRVSNLTSQKSEPYSPDKESYQPSIKIAPEQFTYYNYKGTYTNWQELGKWYYDNLLKGRDVLPISTVETIKSLVKDLPTDKEKAKKIYEYLQAKTRYISVQIGIGGFQPFTAAEVDRLGYGDCKALVNYMQSLLNVVGIESYYCVVQAGNEKKSLDPTYASMDQGNHIILCLPLKGDTTWLECTSQKIPFGFLGDFTDDRYVLACTPEGGKLLRTPKLTTAHNLQVREAELTLSNQGNITGIVKTIFSGAQYDNHEHIVGKPLLEQEKLLKEVYAIDNINFDKIAYSQKKDINPELSETLTINIRNYGVANNDKLFLPLNPFNIQRTVPEVRNRIMPVYINRGYTDIDQISYLLPDNFIGNIEPYEKVVNCEYGTYTATAKLEGKKLNYTRKLVLNEGTFPAESYAVYSKFMADINSADHQKLILNLKK
jgi:transglutaminase-like putative cysteine protease